MILYTKLIWPSLRYSCSKTDVWCPKIGVHINSMIEPKLKYPTNGFIYYKARSCTNGLHEMSYTNVFVVPLIEGQKRGNPQQIGASVVKLVY